jgi:hypothetical protein
MTHSPETTYRKATLASAWALSFAVTILATSPAPAQMDTARRIPMSRSLHRPASQFNVNSSTSQMQRVINFPCEQGDPGFPSCGQLTVRFHFDYVIDSEPNDLFEFWVDNSRRTWGSGRNLAGQYWTELSLAPGNHTVTFKYVKNASVSAGMDEARIDNFRVFKSDKLMQNDLFNDWETAPSGWTVPAGSSGWTQATPLEFSMRRPDKHGNLEDTIYAANGCSSDADCPGDAPGRCQTTTPRKCTRVAETWSAMGRVFNFPAVPGKSPKVTFNYFVDSEDDYDGLIVYVDGVGTWFKSGANESGKATIRLPPGTGGPHEFHFEYYKDAAVDYGLDMARVDDIQAVDGNGRIVERHDFNQTSNSFAHTTTTFGWTAATNWAGLTWAWRKPTAPIYYVAPSNSAPLIDGIISQDWPSTVATGPLLLPNQTTQDRLPRPGYLFLQGTVNDQRLHVGLRVPARSAGVGDERGEFGIVLDARRWNTKRAFADGCSAGAAVPRAEDRKLVVSYNVPAGSSTFNYTLNQYKGSCSASNWTLLAAGSAERWDNPVAAIREANESTGNYVDLEFSVKLGTAAAQSEPFRGFEVASYGPVNTGAGFTGTKSIGVGLWHDTLNASGTVIASRNFPHPEGLPLERDNVRSYATVNLTRAGEEVWYNVDGIPDERIQFIEGTETPTLEMH